MRNAQYVDTPIGVLEIAEENGKIVRIGISGEKARSVNCFGDCSGDCLCDAYEQSETEDKKLDGSSEVLKELKKQLYEYFDGTRRDFDLEYELCGTDFEKKVWQLLAEIPYGATVSYGEIAERLGNPKASRAVGNAAGKNNLLILVPCHRVVRGNGSLGGFSAGIDNKIKLQKLEKILD